MKTKKSKRPPRQVWLLVVDGDDVADAFTTSRAAKFHEKRGLGRAVGPYVLAERVREK